MGVVADNAHDPASQKFLRRFFQKAAAFFSLSGRVFEGNKKILRRGDVNLGRSVAKPGICLCDGLLTVWVGGL
jgi:hypothetical protein